jgi:hypothetical protein
MAFDGVMRGAAVALAVAVAGCACSGSTSKKAPDHGTSSGPAAVQSRQPHGTWGAPILSDDFSGAKLDPGKWQVYVAPNADQHPGIAAGTSVSGGRLQLVGGLYSGKDQSAGIISRLAQTYGRWEARLRSDPGNGYSATAFLWPKDMGHPEWAEIDFAEILSGNKKSGGLFIHHGKDDQQVQRTTRADFTQWHTVAVDWLPDHVTFWMDGKKTWTYQGSFIPKQAVMQLYLRNERKDGFRRTASTPKRVTMQVDWIRVYRAPNAAR